MTGSPIGELFGFYLKKKKKTKQNFDPSDKFFKGTGKERTLWISFFKNVPTTIIVVGKLFEPA